MSELYSVALRLLARREHSKEELKRKLIARRFAAEDIETTLEQLATKGLQSDQRFTEAYVRHRVQAGYGRQRIELELQQLKISNDLIAAFLSQDEEFWWEKMIACWEKKFSCQKPLTLPACIQHFNFLLRRGFSSTQIRKLLRN